MGLTLTSAPASEPVSTSEAKAHLRVDTPDEDTYIGTLVAAARTWVEQVTRRALITQTFTLKRDDFWRGWCSLHVPRPPLQSVSSIQYVDADGNTQTWASSNYEVDTSSTPGRIVLADGVSFPTTADQVNAATVTFVAGYGAASAIPADLVHAVKLKVGSLYWNREADEIAAISLLEPYRVLDERVTLVV